MVHLGNRYIEILMQSGQQRLQDSSLFLERTYRRELQQQTDHNGYQELSRSERPCCFNNLVGFDDVTYFEIVEILDTDTTLEPFLDFSRVILESFQ